MTRAKDELNIFRNGRDISNKKDYIKYFYDEQQYLIESKTFTHVMSLEDLNLGFDYEKFVVNNSLISGVKLTIEKKENFKNLCLIFENKIVATLSSRFNLLILEKLEKGYLFKDCIVEYIVLWEDKNLNKVLKHPLCKIIMQKNIIT